MASSGKSEFLRSYTLEGVDGTSLASTPIFTTENGRRFRVLSTIFELTNTSGFVSVATCSIGTNAVTYNNILAVTALTAVSTANAGLQQNILTVVDSIAPSTEVRVNISVAAVATTYFLKVTLIGYYQ